VLRAGARVIRADLLSRRGASVLTGLVIAVAAGALLLTLHIRAALDEPFDDLFRATNAPHVIAAGPPSAVERVGEAPGVARADAPRPMADVPAEIGPTETRIAVVATPPSGGMDRPLLLSGRMPERPGEVALHDGLADFHGLAPGARITAGGVDLRVVGLAVSTQPRAGGWAVPQQVAALGGPDLVAVALRLREPSAADSFAAAAARRAGPDVRVGDWQSARDDFTEDTRRLLVILQSSTLLALLAAGFTLATSIGGRVIGERRRIGLLRAAGMTPGGVTGLLVAHYAVVAAIAAPLGLAAGVLVAPGLLDDTTRAVGMPGAPAPGAALIAGTFVVVVGLVAVATALPAWRAGRLAPVEALALGRGTAATRASRIALVARRLRLPVVVALGARDAFSRPARALLTLSSLTLAAMLVVTAMAFEATMDRLEGDPALRAQPWDLQVETAALAPARVDELIRDRPEVAAVARIYDPRLISADGRVELTGRIVDGPASEFPFATPEGRGALRPGEATLGRGALDALGAEIGDRIRLEASGQPFSVRVVGRHVEPDDDGEVAVIPVTALPGDALRRDVDLPSWAIRLRDGAEPQAVAAALERAAGGRLSAEHPNESLAREAADMRPVVYGLTALLLVIAGVNLLTTLLLGIRERRREVAVFGAVGATPRQVGGTVIAGGALLALIGALAGMPLGAAVFRVSIEATDPADGPDVLAMPGVGWVLLAVPLALAVTAAVSSLAARQAARMPVAGALRAE
jgi:putative ABC transport system permease protein